MQPNSPDYSELLQLLKDAKSGVNECIGKGGEVSSLSDLEVALSETIAQLETMRSLGSAIKTMKRDA
jgi:hypothetical protein